MAQDASWGEEVVPALRKRLESESKTLARRLSAISLPSGDEARSPPVPSPQKHHLAQVQIQHQQQPKPTPLTQRQRTYSSPKTPHPTRIPKARMTNGSGSYNRQPRPQSQENTPKPKQIPTSATSSSRSTFDMPRSNTRGLGLLHESPPFPIDSMSSSSSAGAGMYAQAPSQGQRYGLGLEQPQAHTEDWRQPEEDPPRPSIDSEERPYEHWYRGEVSRNGGVGELKVGRRQEMLDIANYGHFIRSRKVVGGNGGVNGKGAGAGGREKGYLDLLKLRRKRPRAGSIGGLTRKERDSLYLDETDEDGVGEGGFGAWRAAAIAGGWGERVLDQDPPTDFDNDDDDEAEETEDHEESLPTTQRKDEVHPRHIVIHQEEEEDDDFVIVNHNPPQATSDTQPYPYAYAYIPTEVDVVNLRSSTSDSMSSNTNGVSNTSTGERSAAGHPSQMTAIKSTTAPSTETSLPRPSSRQTRTSPPSRIPHPSTSSRRSSDSRSTHNSTSTPTAAATTPSQIPPRSTRSKSDPSSSVPPASSPNPAATTQSAPPSSFNNNRGTSPGSTSASSSPSPPPSSSTSKKTPNATQSRVKPNSKPKPKSKSKAKPPVTKREEQRDKRSSVAMYPTVEGGEELADAIPSWTQPVTREGNWDDVVLPVVARKKGLEGYYEKTNPHLQLKKRIANGLAQEIVAPAPGTFGYDHSKYQPLQVGDDAGGDEFIELDEFGMPNPPPLVEAEDEGAFQDEVEEARDVYVGQNTNAHAPAKPMQVGVQGQVPKRDEKQKQHDEDGDAGAGCCKCVVM